MPENLYKRNDIWHFRAMISGQLYRRSTGFHDLPSARRRASDFERDIRAGVIWSDPKPAPLFAAWAEKCLGIIQGGKRDPKRDRSSVVHALAAWSDRRLTEILSSDCQQYVQQRLAAGMSKGTIAREVVILRRVFRLAVNDDLLRRSPWEGTPGISGDARTRVLTLDEEAAIREHLPRPWYQYLTVALLTGLREAEQLAHRPAWERDGLLYVSAASAKRGKARVVPLRLEATDALKEIRPSDAEMAYWTARASHVRHVFKSAREAAGVDPFTVHDLRRTAATRMAEAGILPFHLQQILGHNSLETTQKYYVHLTRLTLIEAMARVQIPVITRLDTGAKLEANL